MACIARSGSLGVFAEIREIVRSAFVPAASGIKSGRHDSRRRTRFVRKPIPAMREEKSRKIQSAYRQVGTGPIQNNDGEYDNRLNDSIDTRSQTSDAIESTSSPILQQDTRTADLVAKKGRAASDFILESTKSPADALMEVEKDKLLNPIAAADSHKATKDVMVSASSFLEISSSLALERSLTGTNAIILDSRAPNLDEREAVISDSPPQLSVSAGDWTYFCDETGILIVPTEAQLTNMAGLLSFADSIGAGASGAFKIKVPASLMMKATEARPQKARHSCRRYMVERGDSCIYDIKPIPVSINAGRFRPTAESEIRSPQHAADAFDALLANSSGLKNVYYRTDVPLEVSAEREAFGVPVKSLISSLSENMLRHTKRRISGLHTPFGYESASTFGAPFACHREDFDLYSLHHLYTGQKIWIVISSTDVATFESCVRTAKSHLAEKKCHQFIRHDSMYIPLSVLTGWGIQYRLIHQKANEIVVTLPRTYHQGFSMGYTRAEALNYAGADWNLTGYRNCTSLCFGERSKVGRIPERYLARLADGEVQLNHDADDEEATDVADIAIPRRHKGRPAVEKRKRQLKSTTQGAAAKRARLEKVVVSCSSDLEMAQNESIGIKATLEVSTGYTPKTIEKAFRDAHSPKVLMSLFYRIGSSEMLANIQEIFAEMLPLVWTVEDVAALPHVIATQKAAEVVSELIHSEHDLARLSVKRRRLLVQLEQHYQLYLTEPSRVRASRREDRRSRALMRLVALMQEDQTDSATIPSVDGCYLEKMKGRIRLWLRKSKIWYELYHRFGSAILLLVPFNDKSLTATRYFFSFISHYGQFNSNFDFSIETLSSSDLKTFLFVLIKFRDEEIKTLCKQVDDRLRIERGE